MHTNNTLTSKTGARLTALLMTLCLLLGIAPIVVLADDYGKQGEEFKILMTDPGSSAIITTKLSNGDYLNEISLGYDAGQSVVFKFEVGDGGGTNNINPPKDLVDYLGIFTSESLSEESRVALYDGVGTSIQIVTGGKATMLQRGKEITVSLTGLVAGQTYYLAFLKGLIVQTTGNQGQKVPLGDNNIIFKFETLADASKVDSVSLNENGILFDGTGQTYTLVPTVKPDAATNKAVQWTSSDPAAATVDADGKVSSVAPGKAVITATTEDGNKQATCEVTVRDSSEARILVKSEGTQTTSNGQHYRIESPTVYKNISNGQYLVPDVFAEGASPKFVLIASPNGGRQSTTFNVNVYSNAALTKKTASVGDGIASSVPDYTTGTFTVDPSHLKDGSVYYFVLEGTSTCGSVAYEENIVIEFSVEKDEEPEPVHTHTEEVIKGTPATCTEKGLTDGKKCSVCGEILEEQKEIEKLPHTEEVIKGTPATCTEKGLTEGKKCSVCGEVLKEQKEIRELGHKYENGKCTRCGAEDPDYKPVEPEKHYDGVVKGPDGKWAYYKNDVLQNDYTGIQKNQYGWWRILKGYVDFDAQGIYRNEYGWWKTTDGKVTFDETGVFQNDYGWWRVKDSKVDFDAQGIYQNQYGWWKTTDGKVTFKENGVFRNDYGWWKVEKSKVDFKFTGIAKNSHGTWYVKNGKVDFSKNGNVTYNGKAYQVTNGKAKAI